jgi:hypothetical protein
MIGEAIPHELGAEMVKNYQEANPGKNTSYYIGKDIISQILSQPDCVGIKFYHAYNEENQHVLVYMGIDSSGCEILQYSLVDNHGQLEYKKAIVADRGIGTGGSGTGNNSIGESDWWDFSEWYF